MKCQKDTVAAILGQGVDYLLSVKDNQPTLKQDIEDYVQKVLNIIRKVVINSIRLFKDRTQSEKPFPSIMLACLIDPSFILDVVMKQN